MSLALVVFVVVVVVEIGSFILSKNVDGLNVLSAKTEVCADKTLAMFSILMGSGHLETEFTQIRSLSSPLQIHLHELDLLGQPVDDPVKVSMPLEVRGDAPLCHLVSFFVEYLPMGFIGVHGGVEPLRHGFEGFILVVEGGFGIYVHNVRHRVDGGSHGVGGDVPVIEVSYPLRGHQVAIFVGDSGVGGTAFVVGFESIWTSVHVVRNLELLFDAVFKLLYT